VILEGLGALERRGMGSKGCIVVGLSGKPGLGVPFRGNKRGRGSGFWCASRSSGRKGDVCRGFQPIAGEIIGGLA